MPLCCLFVGVGNAQYGFLAEGWASYLQAYRCSAGDTLVTVMPDGDVYPCRRLPVKVGNIRETRLRDLYLGSRLMRDLRDRDRVAEGCEGCHFARICGGGSRCLSHAVNGDPFRADPGCWLAFNGPGPTSGCLETFELDTNAMTIYEHEHSEG